MRKWIIASIVLLSAISLFLFVTPGKSRLKSYYNGDAISYKNQLYVATANTGSLEVFKLSGSQLDLVAKVKPYNYRFMTYGDFYDTKLSVENGTLYAYAVSNYTLYKYQLSGRSLLLVDEVKNTYWEWYNQVDKFGNDIVTLSAKGLNVYNNKLEQVLTHDFVNKDAPYNISGNKRFFVNVQEYGSKVIVYDRESQDIVANIPVNFKYDKGNRKAYIDEAGSVYVVDDYYTKKFDLSGKLLGSFRHLDYQGFDITASGYTNDIYFSDGVGVVKLDKNMDLLDYAWTGNMGEKNGWAMGLKVVYNNGDKVVLFNNTGILVLNEKLDLVASVSANEMVDEGPIENLYLNLDRAYAAPNSEVLLSGGGYFPYEQLDITMGKTRLNSVTDANGRLSLIIKVPQMKAGRYDIKVEGVKSKLSYSIAFQVE